MENPYLVISQKLDKIQATLENLNNQSKGDLPENDLINVNYAAKILDTTKGTIYNLVHEKRIPYHKQGSKLYFFKSELLKWIKEGRRETSLNITDEVNQVLSEQKPKPRLEQMADKIGQHNKKRGQRSGKPQSTPSKEQGKDKGNDVKIS